MLQDIEDIEDIEANYRSFNYEEVIEKSKIIINSILEIEGEKSEDTKTLYLKCSLYLIDSLRLVGEKEEALNIHLEIFKMLYSTKYEKFGLSLKVTGNIDIMEQLDILRYYLAYEDQYEEYYSMVYNYINDKHGENFCDNLTISQIKNLKSWDLSLFSLFGLFAIYDGMYCIAENIDSLIDSLLKFNFTEIMFNDKNKSPQKYNVILDGLYFRAIYFNHKKDHKCLASVFNTTNNLFNLDKAPLNDEQRALFMYVKALCSNNLKEKTECLLESLELYDKYNHIKAFDDNISLVLKLCLEYGITDIEKKSKKLSQTLLNKINNNFIETDKIKKEEDEEDEDLVCCYLIRPYISI